MKLHQEFVVPRDVATVWAFFDQPERVAACMPGVEELQVLDAETFSVRATQSLGPISATFQARVAITEKVAPERIAFTSTGKALRGAAGSFRSELAVRLVDEGGRTRVLVNGEAALAGVLGSVGQKIVERQAAKLTDAFAANLAAALDGGQDGAGNSAAVPPRMQAYPAPQRVFAPMPIGQAVASERWAKLAAVFSGASLVVLLILLGRSLGH